MELAESLAKEDELEEALAYAERAAAADGAVNFQDLDILLFICIMHVRRERFDELHTTISRIEAVIPDDPDARRFVAYRLVKDGAEFAKIKNFKAAGTYLKYAHTFDPQNHELVKEEKRMKRFDAAIREWPVIQRDPAIILPLEHFIQFDLMILLDVDIPDREARIKGILKEFDSFTPSTILKSLQHLKNQYPACYWLGDDRFDKLIQITKEMLTQGPRYAPTHASTAPAAASSGCVLVLGMVLSGLTMLSCLFAVCIF